MSKLKKISGISAVGITVLAASSCGKYDDGPNISLMSKKSRVVGPWNVKSIGSQILTNGYSLTLDFDKKGSLIETIAYSGGNYSYAGSWAFATNKENLMLTANGDVTMYEIKRLTNKEMWLDDDVSALDGDIMKLEAK